MVDLREKIKLLIDIHEDTNDALLDLLIDSVSSRLCILLGADTIPTALEYVVIDVCIIRFNRIGSEGTNSHTVDGESYSFMDSDFAPYMPEIKAYREQNNDVKKGKVRFI